MSDVGMMRKAIGVSLVLAMTMVMPGCDTRSEVQTVKLSPPTPRKVWVFMQINVPEEGNTIEDYYYYARIPQSTYDDIKRNTIARGFLTLEDVRYYGDDKQYHYYRDEDSSGELVFRIEDIKRIELLRKAPLMKDADPKARIREEASDDLPAQPASEHTKP